MSANCPVCKSSVTSPGGTLNRLLTVACPRCGNYLIGNPELAVIETECSKKRNLWAVTSYALRRAQGSGEKLFVVTSSWLQSVWAQPKLPNPQLQANAFVEYVGSTAVAAADWVGVEPVSICGLIGTADSPVDGNIRGLTYLLHHLQGNGLIEEMKRPPAGPSRFFRLTFSGWEHFESLRRSSVESRAAFMAMDFHNSSVQSAFSEFVRGVALTGFELLRLDQKPKAGLIDNRMRVEIRAAKFIVADLTDDNRGAYWEAGFAEGAGKKVYYTCEAAKFDKAKTHFDTEHMMTIKWVPKQMHLAVDELKSAIRNDFPVDAIQSDITPPTAATSI